MRERDGCHVLSSSCGRQVRKGLLTCKNGTLKLKNVSCLVYEKKKSLKYLLRFQNRTLTAKQSSLQSLAYVAEKCKQTERQEGFISRISEPFKWLRGTCFLNVLHVTTSLSSKWAGFHKVPASEMNLSACSLLELCWTVTLMLHFFFDCQCHKS